MRNLLLSVTFLDSPTPESFRVLFDDADAEMIARHEWVWMNGYAICLTPGQYEYVVMHRAVCHNAGLLDDVHNAAIVVHHRNVCTLDNRRRNLAAITHREHRGIHARRDTIAPNGSRYLALYKQYRTEYFGDGPATATAIQLGQTLQEMRREMRQHLERCANG